MTPRDTSAQASAIGPSQLRSMASENLSVQVRPKLLDFKLRELQVFTSTALRRYMLQRGYVAELASKLNIGSRH